MVILRRFLVIFTLLGVHLSLGAQVCDTNLWVPNGPVTSLVLRDSLLFVGGTFDQVAPVTGSFVTLDSANANVVSHFPLVNGNVYAMAKDSAGNVYVGGDFFEVGGRYIQNLFRLDALGRLDTTFMPNPDSMVTFIMCYNHRVWIGGKFSVVDGFPRGKGACFDDSGNLLQWDPVANGIIRTMFPDAVHHAMLIGGDFTALGNYGTAIYLAKVDTATGAPVYYTSHPWRANQPPNAPVYGIVVINNNVFVAGSFTALGSINKQGLALVHLPTGNVLTTGPNLNGPLYTMQLFGDKIYFGGNFSQVNSSYRTNIACIDTISASGFAVQPWAPVAYSNVRCIALWNSSVVCAGGDFKRMSLDTAYHAALVDTGNAATVHQWNPELNGIVYALLPVAGGKIYAGGSFFGAGGTLQQNLCAININTRHTISWKPVVDGTVTTLFADGNNLYCTGSFSHINTLPRNETGAFSLASLGLLSFNPGVNGLVRTMAGDNNVLYFGGNFTQAGGQTRNNIACINIASGQATSWNPGCSGTVNKILLDDDHVYVGGFFPLIGGVSRSNLARVSAATAYTDPNWLCDADNGVYDMDLSNGKIYLGGWFTTVAGQPRSNLAAIDTGAVLQSFAPTTDNFVRLFARYGNVLFMSGAFSNVNATYHPFLAGYDFWNNTFSSWNPSPQTMPVALQATQQWIYAGGSFRNFNSALQPYLVAIDVQQVTGIAENNVQHNLSLDVMPNPAADYVFVSLNDNWGKVVTVNVLDVNGKNIQQQKFSTDATIRLDISALARGIYFVQVVNENGMRTTGKMVKE